MITIRRAHDRGQVDHGWLQSAHTFSFANYYDPNHMGFRDLRVINEDHIQAGKGFPTHPHRDMEIITYVISGALSHRDSIGNVETIGASGVQRFTAGTGITHSEFNPSLQESTHILQIWILPDQQGLQPSYEQKVFPVDQKRGQWQKIASREADQGAVKLHQNAELYATILAAGGVQTYPLQADRHAWVQIVQGDVTLNGHRLTTGDAAAISQATLLSFTAEDETEILLFDLA